MLLLPRPAAMITRFITDVTTRFNPFSPRAKAARVFLSFLPPTARASGMKITTQLLPRASAEPSSLHVKFSTLCRVSYSFNNGTPVDCCAFC